MSAFTYGGDTDKDGVEPFWLRFSPCTREPNVWKEEAYAAARSIVNRTKKPIWICSSGGIDSEVACRAFFDQGINFSVLTLEHEAGTNSHDIRYTIQWCRSRGVAQKIVKIDMSAFFASEIDAYAKRYPAIHPFRYFQIKLMELVEEMGGYAVLGSGEQLFQVDLSKQLITRSDVFLPLSNGNAISLEWCKDNRTSHEPYFHFSTPELCLSYIRLPLVSFALSNPETVFRHKANSYTFKRVVYQSIWTDMTVRYKYDGYENVRPQFEEAKARLRDQFEGQYIPINLPITSFEAQLTGTTPSQ